MPRLLRVLAVLVGLVVGLVGALWVSMEQMWGDQVVAPPYDNIVVSHQDGAMSVTGSLGEVWLEPVDDETWVVLRSIDGAEPEELFRGPQEDAERFADTAWRTVLVAGTEDEVNAWLAAHERGPQLIGPLLTVGAGVGLVLLGLLTGRRTSTVPRATAA